MKNEFASAPRNYLWRRQLFVLHRPRRRKHAMGEYRMFSCARSLPQARALDVRGYWLRRTLACDQSRFGGSRLKPPGSACDCCGMPPAGARFYTATTGGACMRSGPPRDSSVTDAHQNTRRAGKLFNLGYNPLAARTIAQSVGQVS